jgi:Pyruvate/2-oxoacid:ferredoxin oxidoreductase delta subunit
MCEFCHKHGEGKVWYLQARNYAEDLASDLRRRRFTEGFFHDFADPTKGVPAQLERLGRAPRILQPLIRGVATRWMKKNHFGQVLPIEDVEKVFEIVNCVVRVPCVCRQAVRKKEARYCFGISLNPTRLWSEGMDFGGVTTPDGAGLERLEHDEALGLMRDFEREGLIHSVWAFVTPFIGGICNCDRADCLGLRSTVDYKAKAMFKGEYVAGISPDACTGCRACMRQCQFGAILHSRLEQKCFVDVTACYGCGICRATCTRDAIRLVERVSVPAVARDW